jgi:adenosylhomocysteinase
VRSLGFDQYPLSRDWAGDARKVVTVLSRIDERKRILLVDIGGYFAGSINEIDELMPGRILGLMEGTENGVQKYEESGIDYHVPIITVARSPLKLPEDYLVGAGVVFSVEATLREQAQILQSRSACVVGYGRVGSGVAEVLRGRGIPTVVHDVSPLAMAEAAARGFRVFRRQDEALRQSNLVISATGKAAMTARALSGVRSGTVIATVTSSDDEFEPGALLRYRKVEISRRVTRYENDERHYFWLVNEGDAANFLDDAVIGPAIQLIEGEKLAALKELVEGVVPVGAFQKDVSMDRRELVASTWNEHFLED